MKNSTTSQYGDVLRGAELPQAKLNDSIVRRIRAEHAQAQADIKQIKARYSPSALAREYGVTMRTIEAVLAYQTWRHVR